MENYKKCSLEEEKEIDAICYCQECNIYMCNKCENAHSKLFKDKHHVYKLDKDFNDLFTGFCKEDNHNEKLEYYCNDHNKLCCVSCICKLKGKGKGSHSYNKHKLKDVRLLYKNKKYYIENDINNLEIPAIVTDNPKEKEIKIIRNLEINNNKNKKKL